MAEEASEATAVPYNEIDVGASTIEEGYTTFTASSAVNKMDIVALDAGMLGAGQVYTCQRFARDRYTRSNTVASNNNGVGVA